MKKFCLTLSVLLFLPLAGLAAPWGVLAGAVKYKDYGVDKLVRRESIRYTVSQDITPQEEQLFLSSMRAWPQETLKFIRESGREQEFQDIVPVLKQNLVFAKVQTSEWTDVSLEIDREGLCGSNAMGCYEDGAHRIGINSEYREEFAEILIHEIGHYYGMGDQYKSERRNSHPEYSSNANTVQGSVMNDGALLTCDDADGFINLIDLRLSQNNGHFSSRATKGWNSLCHNSANKYQEGKTINRTFDIVNAADGSPNYRFYRHGKLDYELFNLFLSEERILFIAPGDIVQRDEQNRVTVVLTKSPLSYDVDEDVYIDWKKQFKYHQIDEDSVEIHVTSTFEGQEVDAKTLLIRKGFTSSYFTAPTDDISPGAIEENRLPAKSLENFFHNFYLPLFGDTPEKDITRRIENTLRETLSK